MAYVFLGAQAVSVASERLGPQRGLTLSRTHSLPHPFPFRVFLGTDDMGLHVKRRPEQPAMVFGPLKCISVLIVHPHVRLVGIWYRQKPPRDDWLE